MYISKHIVKFIEETNELAEAAAQAVFDARQPELERKIHAQMKAGDIFYVGMGTATFEKERTEAMENFSRALQICEHTKQRAGFNIDTIKK